MPHILLPDAAARQLIDSTTVFLEWRRVSAQARQYVGGMYFKKEQGYEYLVKTLPNNRQQRLGRRSAETEQILANFTSKKQESETRLKSLTEALAQAQRMNKALKVGRTPEKVVAVLNALDRAELLEHFIVVGTHSLYAYETAAGVRIEAGALATQDVDLLWDARKRVRFITQMGRLDQSMLQLLRDVDPQFRRKDGHLETVIDGQGFEIDFLRREQADGDPHPFRFTEDEDDVWPVQAERASVLTSSRVFEHVVVSATGRMAFMRTIDPETFVTFKQWMAQEAKHRESYKRRRDKAQAEIVKQLLDEGLLMTAPA